MSEMGGSATTDAKRDLSSDKTSEELRMMIQNVDERLGRFERNAGCDTILLVLLAFLGALGYMLLGSNRASAMQDPAPLHELRDRVRRLEEEDVSMTDFTFLVEQVITQREEIVQLAEQVITYKEEINRRIEEMDALPLCVELQAKSATAMRDDEASNLTRDFADFLAQSAAAQEKMEQERREIDEHLAKLEESLKKLNTTLRAETEWAGASKIKKSVTRDFMLCSIGFGLLVLFVRYELDRRADRIAARADHISTRLDRLERGLRSIGAPEEERKRVQVKRD
jgi:hypothetical protein